MESARSRTTKRRPWRRKCAIASPAWPAPITATSTSSLVRDATVSPSLELPIVLSASRRRTNQTSRPKAPSASRVTQRTTSARPTTVLRRRAPLPPYSPRSLERCCRAVPRSASMMITDVEPIVLRLDAGRHDPRRRHSGRLPRPHPYRRGTRRDRRGGHVPLPRPDDGRDALVARDRARPERAARRRGPAADRPAMAAHVPCELPLRPRAAPRSTSSARSTSRSGTSPARPQGRPVCDLLGGRRIEDGCRSTRAR